MIREEVASCTLGYTVATKAQTEVTWEDGRGQGIKESSRERKEREKAVSPR